jgi:hypothetical protein
MVTTAIDIAREMDSRMGVIERRGLIGEETTPKGGVSSLHARDTA